MGFIRFIIGALFLCWLAAIAWYDWRWLLFVIIVVGVAILVRSRYPRDTGREEARMQAMNELGELIREKQHGNNSPQLERAYQEKLQEFLAKGGWKSL